MIIVALDTSSTEEAERLINTLQDKISNYKVGLEQYLASQGEMVNILHKRKQNTFLDLKFHDISNTVAAAAREVTKKGVWMFNIHVTAPKTMKQAVKARDKEAERLNIEKPLIMGVTLLTSLTNQDLEYIGGFKGELEDLVVKRAILAKESGLDGVVASPREVSLIKEYCGTDFLTVCPGIRPSWSQSNDQKRFMTPAEAISNGADYLVIGRPITRAEKPLEAVDMIFEELNQERS